MSLHGEPHPVCPGATTRPASGTTEYKRVGNTPVAVRGQCSHCRRTFALTSGGWIWWHRAPASTPRGGDHDGAR